MKNKIWLCLISSTLISASVAPILINHISNLTFKIPNSTIAKIKNNLHVPLLGNGLDAISGAGTNASVFSNDSSHPLKFTTSKPIYNDDLTKFLTHSQYMKKFYMDNNKKYGFFNNEVGEFDVNVNSFDWLNSQQSLNLYYIFSKKEVVTLDEKSISVTDFAKNKSQGEPHIFCSLFGSQYVNQFVTGSYGIIHLSISTDSLLKTHILKNDFMSKNILPGVGGRSIIGRGLLKLGMIDWDRLFDSPTKYNINLNLMSRGFKDPSGIPTKLSNTIMGTNLNLTAFNQRLQNIYVPFTDWIMNCFTNAQNNIDFSNRASFAQMSFLAVETNTIKTKPYSNWNLKITNPYDLNFLNQIEIVYNQYLQFQKDLVYMYSFEDKMGIFLRSQIFNYDGYEGTTLETALEFFWAFKDGGIDTILYGVQNEQSQNFLKNLKTEVYRCKFAFSSISANGDSQYMKKIDFLLRFEVNFKMTYPLYNNDFEADGVFIPLDLETLKGDASNYGFYNLTDTINEPVSSTFKLDTADFNFFDKTSNLKSYNPNFTENQNFTIHVGMYDVYRNIKTQDIPIKFNLVKSDNPENIVFQANSNWSSEFTNTILTWHYNTNSLTDQYHNINFVKFGDLFTINSNWKIVDSNE